MKWHDVQQNTDAWQALRCGKATASSFALFMANDGKAFGDPAKRLALQIALEQITGRKAEHGFSNEHTEQSLHPTEDDPGVPDQLQPHSRRQSATLGVLNRTQGVRDRHERPARRQPPAGFHEHDARHRV